MVRVIVYLMVEVIGLYGGGGVAASFLEGR